MREEEAEQRLETLLALPVCAPALARRAACARGRLAAPALALAAGLLAWAGAASQGADVSLGAHARSGRELPARRRALPRPRRARLALVPRAGDAIAYALVGVAFLWETVGGLIAAPELGARPLAVPPRRRSCPPSAFAGRRRRRRWRVIGALAGLLGAWRFERRDLSGP